MKNFIFVLLVMLSSCGQRESLGIQLGDADFIFEIKGDPDSTVIEIYDLDLKQVAASTVVDAPNSIGEIRTAIAHMINDFDYMFLMKR